jgi:hypothetical protein
MTLQLKSKPVELRPVRPNAGVEALYRKQLLKFVDAMHKSVLYWLKAQYRANAPAIAMDAPDGDNGSFFEGSAANAMNRQMKRLARRWGRQFDEASPKLAKWFSEKAIDRSQDQLKQILKDGGFSVEFKLTAPARDAYAAVLNQNVALIKSIPEQYLTQVQGMVMRSVSTGRDLGTLTKEIEHQFKVTRRRAALIARDQNNRATAVINRVRQKELGITTAIWKHSHAGKHPRASHLAFDGKEYDVEKGAFIDGKWIFPGEEINCLPGDSKIEFAAGCKKLWRNRFAGELVEIITASGKSLKATPNHPVLTSRGWIPIQLVNLGDDVFSVSNQAFNSFEMNVEDDVPSFEQVFDTLAGYVGVDRQTATGSEFHGDAADGEINVVAIDRFLSGICNIAALQSFCEFFFTKADEIFVGAGFKPDRATQSATQRLFAAPQRIIRALSTLLPLLKGSAHSADNARFAAATNLHVRLQEAAADGIARDVETLGQFQFADPGQVGSNDFFIGQLLDAMSRVVWDLETPSADVLGKAAGVDLQDSAALFHSAPRLYQSDRVVDKRRASFAHDVFNLETRSGWYSSGEFMVHNCRCISKSVIPGFIP